MSSAATPHRVRKLAQPVRYISREAATKVAQMRADYQVGDEEAMAVARSGWDMAAAFARWVRSIARWIVLGILIVLAYLMFGWVFAASTICGTPAAWFLGNVFLHGRYEIVDNYNEETLQWDTWEVGVIKFKEMRHTGLVSPVSSSMGTIRYLVTAFDPDAGIMESAWITELSSFQYLVDMKTHARLRNSYEENLDRFLDAIGYSSVQGKLQAAEHIQAFIDAYDTKLNTLGPAYTIRPATTHEIVETPVKENTDDETTTASEAQMPPQAVTR